MNTARLLETQEKEIIECFNESLHGYFLTRYFRLELGQTLV